MYRIARHTRLTVLLPSALLLVSTSAESRRQVRVDASSNNVHLAIERIKAGRHSEMPDPARSVATGQVGEGLTIENGTGKRLTVYFLGPVTRLVQIGAGASTGVSLVVGQYEAAAEPEDPAVIPFYGSLRF